MSQPTLTNTITDMDSFIKFLNSLRTEFESDPAAWENNTLASFLGALAAYANDVQGYYDNFHLNLDANVPSWQVFADILIGATIYE